MKNLLLAMLLCSVTISSFATHTVQPQGWLMHDVNGIPQAANPLPIINQAMPNPAPIAAAQPSLTRAEVAFLAAGTLAIGCWAILGFRAENSARPDLLDKLLFGTGLVLGMTAFVCDQMTED